MKNHKTTNPKMARVFTKEYRDKIATSVGQIWSQGGYTIDHLMGTPEEMSERSKRAWKKMRANGNWKKISESVSRALLGKHGFGRSAKGALDHHSAKRWTIKSPSGMEFTFDNLREWVRQNLSMFPDPNPHSKTSNEYRVVMAFYNLLGNERLNHARGWLIINCEKLQP